jgi:TIR domain
MEWRRNDADGLHASRFARRGTLRSGVAVALAETQPPYLVFISHSSEDRWIARQMAAIIERKAKRYGVRTFLDEKDLEAGAVIPEEIRRHLESCEEFLVLLTSLSISRQWVLLELGAGLGTAQAHRRHH